MSPVLLRLDELHFEFAPAGGEDEADDAWWVRDAWLKERLRPGAVVRVLTGAHYLVGHTNDGGGVCDCCTDWRWPDVVAIAMAVVLDLPQPRNAGDS